MEPKLINKFGKTKEKKVLFAAYSVDKNFSKISLLHQICSLFTVEI